MVATEKQNGTDDGQGRSEAASSGKSELDSLLSEFDTQTDRKPESDMSRVLETIKPLAQFAKSRMEKDRQDGLKADIDDAFKFMTEADELKSLKPTHVRGFMEAYAVENVEFSAAFQNREAKPQEWKSALQKGRDWLVGEISEFGKSDLKEDVEAAKAAVDGATDEVPNAGKGPSSKEMFAMSDVEWENYMDAESAEAG